MGTLEVPSQGSTGGVTVVVDDGHRLEANGRPLWPEEDGLSFGSVQVAQ